MISLKSKITRNLLLYLFINPQQSLYVNEIARKIKADKRNLVKKIKELEKEGILICQTRGNLKLYSINKNYPLYKETRNIFLKTEGIEHRLKEIIKEVKGIKEIYIYGSYVKSNFNVYSDIDLLAIGSHSIVALQKHINGLQKEIDREINIVNIDEDELNRRIDKKDPFIIGILKGKHVRIKR